jgi:small conductance mechanosensitive channel
VGLALQGTLANVAAGVMLLILRPYRVGDVVNIGGNTGTVQRLDLFFTQLSDGNNVKIMAPNGKVFGDIILNLSGQRTRRIELKIGVGYGDNLNQAKEALAGAAAAQEKVLADPAPWAGVTNLLDSSVEITLTAWVKSDDYWQTRADVFQAAKEALDAAGIEIPFPHQVAVPYEEEIPASPQAEGPRGLRGRTNPRSAGIDTAPDGDVQDEA